MNVLEHHLDIELGQEARQRELLQMFEDGEYEQLLAAAELLNVALGQQLTINRWLAKEAADNLGEAWNTYRELNGEVC